MPGAQVQRERALRAGIRLEALSVIWMIVEAIVSLGAGVAAASLLLVAFGLDSVIELVSGATLLWRLTVEARGGNAERVEWAERRAAWLVATALTLLCVYVLGSAIYGFARQARHESSPVGIAISVAAVVVMPWLGLMKRRLAVRLDSGALRGDAASSFTCAYMAAAVLVGLVLNALFRWWWVEDVAALVFLFWLVGETREAWEVTRGEGASEESAD